MNKRTDITPATYRRRHPLGVLSTFVKFSGLAAVVGVISLVGPAASHANTTRDWSCVGHVGNTSPCTASYAEFLRIKPGMTKPQVRAIYGNPGHFLEGWWGVHGNGNGDWRGAWKWTTPGGYVTTAVFADHGHGLVFERKVWDAPKR